MLHSFVNLFPADSNIKILELRRHFYAYDLDGCPKCVSLTPDGTYFIRSSERGFDCNLRIDLEDDDISIDCSSLRNCERCSVMKKCSACNSERRWGLGSGSQTVEWSCEPKISVQHQTNRSNGPASKRRKILYCCTGGPNVYAG